MRVLEKDVERYLKRRVEQDLKGKCIKIPAIYEEGIPDRLLVLPEGRIAFVELKRPKGGVLAPKQEYWHMVLRRLGCKVYVVKNCAEVEAMLREI